MKIRLLTLTAGVAISAGIFSACGDTASNNANNSRSNMTNMNSNANRMNSNTVTNLGTDNANVGAVVLEGNNNGAVSNMNSSQNRMVNAVNSNMRSNSNRP